jgi:hypothetical protein
VDEADSGEVLIESEGAGAAFDGVDLENAALADECP